MAPAPLDRTIADANTGETLTFLETAAESSGDRVVMRLALARRTVVPPHAHPTEEAFECQEGKVDFQLDGHPIELRPGSKVTVPAGRVHGLRNASDQPAVLGIVATPGAEAEYGLRVKFLMSRYGYIPVPGSGPPKNVLLGAVVIQRGGLYFPPLPRWLFRTLMASVAALGAGGGASSSFGTATPSTPACSKRWRRRPLGHAPSREPVGRVQSDTRRFLCCSASLGL